MERRTPHIGLTIEHPDDEDYCGSDPTCSRMMKTTTTALDSTRSQESVLVQVGQPFDEPVEEEDHVLQPATPLLEEKKEEEPTAAAAAAPPSSLLNKKKNARVLMLMSTFGRSQMSHQERAMMLLESTGIPYNTIDGSAPNRKDERNALFQLSGMRGVYPQFFLVTSSGDDDNDHDEIAVIGNFDALESINEASTLPNDVLQSNQEILTWDRLMGKTKSERMMAIVK